MRISKATYYKYCPNCKQITPHQLEGFLGKGKHRFRCKICGGGENNE